MNVQTRKQDFSSADVMAHSSDRPSQTLVIWLLAVTVIVLRIDLFSWTPVLLSTDSVNLAYALDSFDPGRHQPHPPGYPLFVGFARLIHLFSPNPEVTLWISSVIATIVSVSMLYFFAKLIVSPWAALAASILFLLNPVFWFSRLQSPLRPWLALFSLITAYCAWRCWHGERRFAFYGAAALGVGVGFRPDLLAYLLPLWAVSAWIGTGSWKVIAQGGVIIAGCSAVWFGIVMYAMGGIASTTQTIVGYLQDQSRRDSLLFAESIRMWLRPISRLVIWNGIALVGWIWAAIIGYRRLSAKDIPWKFLLIWIGPGLTFQMFFHIAAPGHTLFATPAFCLAGACVISMLGRHRNGILTIAAIVNVALFLNAVPLGYAPTPSASSLEKAWVTVRNSIGYGTFETSQGRLRWTEEMAEVSLRELSRFRVPDRPNVIIALNGNAAEFEFANWRVIAYYMDQQPLWVLGDHLPPDATGRIRMVRDNDVQVSQDSSIRIPRGGRVLWILQQDGLFQRTLEQFVSVQRGRYIVYSDIPSDTAPFEIDGFRFVPE